MRSRGSAGRDGLLRDLIEAGLNEPRVAGSGYGDCVAAPIRQGERAPWADGGEAMAACVRARPQGASARR